MGTPGKGDISKSWVEYLRTASRQFKNQSPSAPDLNHARPSRKRPGPAGLESQDEARGPGWPDDAMDSAGKDERDSKKVCSPQSSPPPSTPSQSQAKRTGSMGELDRWTKGTSTRQLWTPNNEQQYKASQPRAPLAASASHAKRSPQPRHSRQPQQHQDRPPQVDTIPFSLLEAPTSDMILQPETRPISQEQLVAEVKGIYAGLVMVESKCIEVDNVQSSNKDSLRQLSNEQWQALIALHRTLLHEHHDFFLASQHPSANPALRRLASKYSMPARMWRHGIHSFLELLRHKLPSSLEPMLTFIYIAYSMMALLYETVPAFEETWIECLGDLGRYRMAIEDDNIRDRETWTAVSRYWYSKASDKSPTTGRLYHHLAILARPNALQQVYYYTKSLCVPTPFMSARESVMTLFDPVLSSTSLRLEPIDAAFVRVHAILFSGKSKDQLEPSMTQFYNLLDGHIAGTTKGWLESGYYMGISQACSLLGYGDEFNVLKRATSSTRAEDSDAAAEGSFVPTAEETFEQTLSFTVRTYEIITHRWGDMNILPYLHTQLAFLRHMSKFPVAMPYIEGKFPWKLTAMMLNYLRQSCKSEPRMDGEDFPGPQKNDIPRPLPEDFAMRGLIYTEEYFPIDWFSTETADEDEKYFEQASMTEARKERILWLGRRIAAVDKWLKWDDKIEKFLVAAEYDVELDNTPEPAAMDSQDDEEDIYISQMRSKS